MFHHIVSGLSSVKSFKDYGLDFRSHLEAYWINCCIKLTKIAIDPDGCEWQATLGDYDLDCKVGYGRTKDDAIEELLFALDDRIR